MLSAYDCISACHYKKRGGGVPLYVMSCLSCRVLPNYTIINGDYKYIALKCYDAMIAVMHRPPSGSINNWVDFLERLFETSIQLKLRNVFVGDCNINGSVDNPSYVRFEEVL